MKPVVSDNPSGRDRNKIFISPHFHETLGRTINQEWEWLFDQFRLNLQSRIAGADERQLLKLQGNIEYTMELEKFFKEALGAKTAE
jgi:hypothetical protein